MSDFKSGVFIIRIANTHHHDSFRNSLQVGNITDVNISLGWRHVEGKLEDTSVQLVVDVKEIKHSPPVTHVLVSRVCVRLWNLQFNDQVGRRVRLDIFDKVELFENDPIFLLVFWIRFSIVNVNQGGWDDRSANIVDSVDNSHGPELPLKSSNEVVENVHSSVWGILIGIP